jgi:uncharacterized protein YajQ (UPF0234 family)
LRQGRNLSKFEVEDMADIIVTKCKKSDFGIITLKNCKKYQQKSNNLKPQYGVKQKLKQDCKRKLKQNISCDKTDVNQCVEEETQQGCKRKLKRSYKLKVDKNLSNLKEYINNK